MASVYRQTPRVGCIRACLRYIEDPTRTINYRIFLALTHLFILWIISPLDLIPEAILGRVGWQMTEL